MRSIHVTMIALALAMPATGAAQSGAGTPAGDDATSPGTTSPAPKGKGGLSGKVKGLAKNRVVKAVAKTAACTMLPGGQLIAGAIDAGSKQDGAGAAAGLATGSGGGCMPGMTGKGLAGQGMADAAAAAAAGVPGAALPGQPTVAVPSMGISPAQMKDMEEQYRKMGVDPARLKTIREMMANLPAGTGTADGEGGVLAEENRAASYSLVKGKGRIVLRRLPWSPGSAVIQPGGESVFRQAISDLAAEMLHTARSYKIEVKVEEQGSKGQSQLLAKKRAAVMVGALAGQGVPQTLLTSGGGTADKDPRVVISETETSR